MASNRRVTIDPNVGHRLLFRCRRHNVDLVNEYGGPALWDNWDSRKEKEPWFMFDLDNMRCPKIEEELKDIVGAHQRLYDNLLEEDAEMWAVTIDAMQVAE